MDLHQTQSGSKDDETHACQLLATEESREETAVLLAPSPDRISDHDDTYSVELSDSTDTNAASTKVRGRSDKTTGFGKVRCGAGQNGLCGLQDSA